MKRRALEPEIVDLLREAGLPEDGGELRELVTELVRLYRQGFLRLHELRERLIGLRGPPEETFFD